MRRDFGSDLAVVSYLRGRIEEDPRLSFGQLLYSALYTADGRLFSPEPSDVHRHLVAVFGQYPGRVWTTNYDDLLEEAARSIGVEARTLNPLRRTVGPGFAVAHLHGFLAPPARAEAHPSPSEVEAILTLAEEDFYAIGADLVGWTNREFYRLFDEHQVLMLGMSLDDPNVRRVLAGTVRTGREAEPRHFAVLRSVSIGEGTLPRVGHRTREIAARDACLYA